MPPGGVLAVVHLPLHLLMLMWMLLMWMVVLMSRRDLCQSRFSGLPFAGLESVAVRRPYHLVVLSILCTGLWNTLGLSVASSLA